MRKFLFSCTMLAAFSTIAVADELDCPFAYRSEPGVCPFVSGSEAGWGKTLSPTQRRTMGFDDVRVARKYARKPDTPARGVPGYAFNLLTFRHGIHGHDGGDGASGNSGGSNTGGSGSGAGPIPPKASPFSLDQIKSEPFGVFTTLQECNAARAKNR